MKILNKIQEELFSITQKLINKAYEKKGLTDDILDLQVQLNELRNKADIPDEDEIVTDDGFVQ